MGFARVHEVPMWTNQGVQWDNPPTWHMVDHAAEQPSIAVFVVWVCGLLGWQIRFWGDIRTLSS